MSALTADSCAHLGVMAEPRALSLYEQLEVAQHQALAALERMRADHRDMQIARIRLRAGDASPLMVAACASHASHRAARVAAIEEIGRLRGLIARAERLAGCLSYPPRPAAPELRAP
jgi:hypothetical protein